MMETELLKHHLVSMFCSVISTHRYECLVKRDTVCCSALLSHVSRHRGHVRPLLPLPLLFTTRHHRFAGRLRVVWKHHFRFHLKQQINNDIGAHITDEQHLFYKQREFTVTSRDGLFHLVLKTSLKLFVASQMLCDAPRMT